ncbi:Uncharacterised protein [Halioglobus japonicus]|nr:Uncharacterised protein [Halioglobus japonicus]
MTPDLVLFGISSIIRLGTAGANAAEQAARDADALFPILREPAFDPISYINTYFVHPDTRDLVQGDTAPYRLLWDQLDNQVIEQPDFIDTLLILSIKIESKKGNAAADPRKRSSVAAGSLMVAQWRDKDQPLNPWIGVILSAADIGLEYVSANPGILEVGTQGEKILGAYAKELAALLPDDGNFGTQHGFGQRLSATFLKAGLNAVADNPGWLSDEEHIQSLISNSIAPLVEAFPHQPLMTQLIWSDLGDAVMGPVAAAAFRTITENPATFLGKKFDSDKAIGAVTRAIFLQVADTGLADQFTKDGLVELSQAVFTVVAEKPALFIGDNEGRTDEMARLLVADLAGVLSKTDSFDRNLARQLAGTAVSTVGANAYRFEDSDDPWYKVAVYLIESVTGTLSEAVVENTALQRVLSPDQLIELGRIVIRNIGASPNLILGDDDAEWNGVIKAIASGMEADERLLLSGSDWLQIAALAAAEASRNPARLFNLKDNQVLAGQLIMVILEAASEILPEAGHGKRSILFGATLLEAVQIAVRAGAGNSAAVTQHLDDIQLMVASLNLFVAENHEKYGSKEWLRIFRLLFQAVLDGAALPALTDEIAEDLLKGVA